MKRNINILFICLLIAGIIVVATLGFNVGLDYRAVNQIAVNVGQQYNVQDIKNIVNQVYKENKVQQVEIYKDLLQISVYGQSEPENVELINKLNEFYGTELTIEKDLTVTSQSNVHLRDLIRPYVLPVVISLLVVAVYFMIVYRAQGPFSVLFTFMQHVIGASALYVSLIAITRVPVNILVVPVGLIVYAGAILVSGFLFERNKGAEAE